MDLRNKTTSEFSTVFDSPLCVPNSQVSLYMIQHVQIGDLYNDLRCLVLCYKKNSIQTIFYRPMYTPVSGPLDTQVPNFHLFHLIGPFHDIHHSRI